ncbi:hypothetical protein DFQ30_002598, partial [Apophysomyces sp. BC1015]
MSLAMDDTDKVKILFEDCITNHLAVLPPDINQSAYRFEPVADVPGKRSNTIRYGLGAIKGSGQSAIEEIVRARESQPFSDLFDFCERIDRRVVNRRTIEALIRAGAFDSLHDNRARLLASVPLAMEAAEQASANALQGGLFDMPDGSSGHQHELVDEPAWTEKRKLQEEKAALGFYISGHLFDAYKDEVRRFVRQKVGELKEGRDKVIAGVIMAMRTQMTQRGKMLVAVLDDGTGQCEVTVFNEIYDANRAIFKEDELLVVQGQARNDSFTGGIRFTVDAVMDLERARRRYADSLLLSVNGNADPKRLRELLELHRLAAAPPSDEVSAHTGNAGRLRNGGGPQRGPAGADGGYGRRNGDARSGAEPGGLRVRIRYRGVGAQCDSTLDDAWRVRPSDDLLNLLRAEFSASAVEIQIVLTTPETSAGKAVASNVAKPVAHVDVLARIGRIVRPYWWAVVLAIVSMGLVAAAEAGIPALLKPLIDKGFGTKDPSSSVHWYVPLSIIGLALVRGLAQYASGYLLSYVLNRTLLDLRLRMFQTMLRAPAAFFQRETASTIINAIVFEVNQVLNVLTTVLVTLVRDSLTVLFLIGYLFYLNWRLTLIVAVILPVIGWLVSKINRRLRRLNREQQMLTNQLSYIVEETVGGYKVVKVHNGEPYEMGRFTHMSRRLRGYAMRVTISGGLAQPLTQFLASIALAVVITIAVIQSASDQTTVGGFVAFVTAMLLVISPLKHLIDVNQPLTRGMTAAELIFGLIDEP